MMKKNDRRKDECCEKKRKKLKGWNKKDMNDKVMI